MSLCTAPQPSTGRDGTARICAVDGWRELGPGRLTVCRPCEGRSWRELGELAHVTGYLRGVAHDPPLGARIPLRIDAYDLALPGRLHEPLGPPVDQIGHTPVETVLAAWVAEWRDWGAQGGRSWGSVWTLSGWLRDRLGWACVWYPRVDQFMIAMRRLLRTVAREVGADTPTERLPLPCTFCGGSALTRVWTDPVDGAETLTDVECGDCGVWWTADEYAIVKAHQLVSQIPAWTLLGAADIAIARPGVLASNVRDWKRRGRLAPVPGPWGGRAVYVLGEVDELVDRIIAARLARHQALSEAAAAAEAAEEELIPA